jgi:hypothetical protein
MAIRVKSGSRELTLHIDADGHRTYTAKFVVECATTDGPGQISRAVGLPTPGSHWAFGSDLDTWAFCTPEVTVEPELKDEPNTQYIVTKTFTTKPKNGSKCQDYRPENPLDEPMEVSGDFELKPEEGLYDRFNKMITNSAWEPIRGAQNEWDMDFMKVKVKQNVPLLQYSLLCAMINTVNSVPLWGQPKRCWRVTGIGWVRKSYGNCIFYYERNFEFTLDKRTHDRDILDEGTKALHGVNDKGNWVITPMDTGVDPDRFNPLHFVQYKDVNGENARCILNGFGVPVGQAVQGDYSVKTAEARSTGLGYAVGDQVQVLGGTSTQPCIITITEVGSEGQVIFASVLIPGQYTVKPDNNVDTEMITVSPGIGATFELTWFDNAGEGKLNQAGKIHVEKYNNGNPYLLGIPAIL